MTASATVLVAALATLMPAAISPGFAQTAAPKTAQPPPASPQPPAVAATTPTGPIPKTLIPPDDQLAAKYVRQTCSDYVKSEGLKDEAMQKAVSDCVAKLRPDLAGKE